MNPRQNLGREFAKVNDKAFIRIFVGDDEYYTLDDVPNTDLPAGTMVTAYTDNYVFYTNMEDTWPDQIRHIPRHPEDYSRWYDQR